MKRYEALGVIDVQYFTIAVELLDQMTKGSDVEFLTSERYLGGRLVTLIIGGKISEVKVAVEIAKQVCQNKPNNPLKMALTITNPHEEILKYIIPAPPKEQEIKANKRKPKKSKKVSKEDLS